ncbi:MAG: hypothetical protein ABIL22_03665 [candidate division WOR-3 bacterium]
MDIIKIKLKEKIPVWKEEIKNLVKEYGDKVISEVTVSQAYGGMRGVKALICDTSEVPPDKGLIIREIPIAQLKNKLPEEVLYLFIIGHLRDKDASGMVKKDVKKRAKVTE